MSRSIMQKWQAVKSVAADGESRRKILRLAVLRYNYPGFGVLRQALGRPAEAATTWTLNVRARQAAKSVALTIRPADPGDVASFFENWIEAPPPIDGLLRAPQVAVDAGAHIGSFALLLHSLYPGCRIIAFEPSRANATLLRRNFEANGVDAQVREAALWHEEKASLFMMEGASNAGFAREDAPAGSDAAGYGVPGQTLAAALGEQLPHLGLLKLDIEGAEYSVLPEILPVLPADCRVWMELHNVAENPGWLPRLLDGKPWSATAFDSFPPHEQWLLRQA